MKTASKVLFLGYDLSRTGAPLLLLKFLQWLKTNSKISAEMLVTWDDGALAVDYRNTITVHCYHEQRRKLNSFFHRGLQKLKLEQVRKPDLNRQFPAADFGVVYANTIATLDLAKELGTQKRRCILHVHELDYVVQSFKVESLLRESASFVSAYITASDAVKQYLVRDLNLPAERISVIHEFPVRHLSSAELAEARVQVRRSLGVDESTFVVGMCGSLDWRKGADLFLQLALHLKRQPGRKYLCLWVGGDPKSPEICHDIRAAGIADSVRIEPPSAHPERYFPAFDVFALTSREDPFSAAMLEAASSGVPIVAFAGAGGAAELIEEDAGVVVPFLDIPAMAQEIGRLEENRSAAKALGARAQAKVMANYQFSMQAPKLFNVLSGPGCESHSSRNELRTYAQSCASEVVSTAVNPLDS